MIPVIGIVTTLVAGGDLLVLLALRAARRCCGPPARGRCRAGHPRGATARQRGRGDGHRRGRAQAQGVDRARRRPQRLRDRSRRRHGQHRGDRGPAPDAEPGRAAGRHRPRDGARAEPRRAAHDAARRHGRRDRADVGSAGADDAGIARRPDRRRREVARVARAGTRWRSSCSCSGC